MTRIVATIEARMGSSRLPGKVLKEAVGKPLLLLMVERVRRSRYVDEVVVATTTNEKDEAIVLFCQENNISYFRGSEENVLERVVEAGQHYQAEVSVLLTGDCPLIDPYVIDQHISAFLSTYPHIDYVTNCEVRSYPHGLDLIVLPWKTLAESLELATIEPFREHVGWYVCRHPERYRRLDIIAPPGISNPFFRITLDYQEDYDRIKAIYEALYHQNPQLTTVDILEYAHKQGWIDS
ncbi:acylneuraminate cytidylyltransferase [Calothrix sp. NIES-2100]|uniref:cytidylyltransferase domain-containing protein n=1 Tax=Calothrix sp. NIES-2100 TaxID=1954172 RepID=UPI000B603CD1|nr:acylneuraminate cytidylyltransferase [Calothrix sp. NIES-2100]